MIKKLLVPNVYDLFWITVGWIVWGLIVLGSLADAPITWYLDRQDLLEFFVYTLMAILIGAGITIAQGKCSRLRALTIMLLTVGAPLLIFGFSQLLSQHPKCQLLNFQPTGYPVNDPLDSIGVFSGPVRQLLVVLFASLIVFGLVRLGCYLVKHKSGTSRKKLLIVVASSLFLLKIIGDVLPMWFPALGGGRYAQVLLSSIFFLAITTLAFFIPRFLLSHRYFWIKFALLVSSIGAALGWGWYLINQEPDFFVPVLSLGICSILFLTSCLGCAQFSTQQLEDETEQDSGPRTKFKLSWLPSVWAMLAFAFFGGSLWGAFQVNEEVLFRTKDWNQAVAAQKITWNSGGAVKMIDALGNVQLQIDENTPENALDGLGDWAPAGQVFVEIQLSENTPANVLSGLQDWQLNSVSISGYGPQVDFSVWKSVKNPLPNLHLGNGKLSLEQSQQVLSQPIVQLYLNDFEVQGQGDFVPKEIQYMGVHGCSTDFLKRFRSFESVGKITSHGRQDWPTLIRGSATTKVIARSFETLPQLDELAGATQQLWLSAECLDASIDDVRRLLAKTEVSIICFPAASEEIGYEDEFEDKEGVEQKTEEEIQQEVLDWTKLALQYPERLNLELSGLDLKFEFAHDDQEQVTGLLISNNKYVSKLKEFPKLKMLSFDLNWLSKQQDRYSYIDLKDLSRLSELEALYFASYSGDLSYLADLKKLRHLQVSATDCYAGVFATAPSMTLESICILGLPEISFCRELNRLPKLKKVVIVDTASDFSSSAEFPISKAEFLKKMKALVPKADFSVETIKEHRLKVPPEFKAYKNKLLTEAGETTGDTQSN